MQVPIPHAQTWYSTVCAQPPSGERPWGRGPSGFGVMLTAASVHSMVAPKHARADGEIEAYVEDAAELLWPILSNLGFSGVMGLAAAAALKVGWGSVTPP